MAQFVVKHKLHAGHSVQSYYFLLLRLSTEVVTWRTASPWRCGPSEEPQSLTTAHESYVNSQTLLIHWSLSYMFMVKTLFPHCWIVQIILPIFFFLHITTTRCTKGNVLRCSPPSSASIMTVYDTVNVAGHQLDLTSYSNPPACPYNTECIFKLNSQSLNTVHVLHCL